MILCDASVLVYAFRMDTPRHRDFRAWLLERLTGPANVGVSDLILALFLRIVTHPRVFREPSPPGEAFAFTEALRSAPNAVFISPGPRHWDIFGDLCWRAGARGDLVPDAYLAALAIEWGCEWVTTDRDYARFPGLRWRHPLD